MKEKSLKNFWLSRFFEIFGFFFLGFTGFLSLALITHHPLDPSFDSATSALVTNKAGIVGAYLSGFLLKIFGLANLLIIAFFANLTMLCFKKTLPEYLTLRSLAFMVSLLCFCLVLSNFPPLSSWQFVTYGGLLGYYLNEQLNHLPSFYLLNVLAFTIFVILFCFAQNISLRATLLIIKRLVRNMGKSALRLLLMIPAKSMQIYVLTKNFVARKFFKKRIKDIDTSYVKKEKKIAKIEQVNIPEVKTTDYGLPSLEFLSAYESKKKNQISKEQLQKNADLLKDVFADFGVNGKILQVKPGPVVTLYEFEPAAGIKSSRIIGLADDVARSMSAISARISVISGQNAIGVELPNDNRETVYLRELFASADYQKNDANLPLALGKTIGGEPVTADLAKMPHLLVAGTTGSGKSVAVNTMILSLIYKLSPAECKFIMIDPKMLELSVYDGIPHLLSPVVTEPKKAVQALRWVVQEMENRYRLMSALGVRNISGYNDTMKKAIKAKKMLTRTVQTGFDQETGKPIFEEVELDMQPLPYIVVIVDEMADLMLVAGKEIESYIQRLAQMARAAGIHLIIATQRPSVDVITGVIKANFPTRISFHVTSKIDSRTILGEQGAEQLLGMGDMLYMYGGSKITRVHGPFVSDGEVQQIVKFLKDQAEPVYINNLFENVEEGGDGFMADGAAGGDDKDDFYEAAVKIVLKDRKVSISYIQRQLKIGYNRAANIVEEMEKEGIVSAPTPTGKREILINE